MILLDREDVVRLGMDGWTYPFCEDRDGVDVLGEGPFVFVVHNEHAWGGRDTDSMERIAGRRVDPANYRRWIYLADLYAEAMGISRHSMVMRYVWMSKDVISSRPEWFEWEKIYHWPEGGDLAWSALVHGHHPLLEVDVDNGERLVARR